MTTRQLQRRGTTNIPERYAITSIYHKFLETGSIGDRADTRRSSTNKSLVHTFVKDETVNRQNYLQMLKDYFYPPIQRNRLNNKMILQQDGTSPRFSKEVRIWLNKKFNGRWIGRGHPLSWALCSPDLTPLGFFLWGYMQTKVYKTKMNDIVDLKERIEQKIKTIKKKRHWKMFLIVL